MGGVARIPLKTLYWNVTCSPAGFEVSTTKQFKLEPVPNKGKLWALLPAMPPSCAKQHHQHKKSTVYGSSNIQDILVVQHIRKNTLQDMRWSHKCPESPTLVEMRKRTSLKVKRTMIHQLPTKLGVWIRCGRQTPLNKKVPTYSDLKKNTNNKNIKKIYIYISSLGILPSMEHYNFSSGFLYINLHLPLLLGEGRSNIELNYVKKSASKLLSNQLISILV